jgi:hypothetical protein
MAVTGALLMFLGLEILAGGEISQGEGLGRSQFSPIQGSRAYFGALFMTVSPSPSPTPIPDAIYEANYQSNTIEVFSLAGSDLGTFATPVKPTGLVFDNAGNLYVSSDDIPDRLYSLLKFAPDGSFSVFANSGLASPHALVFDTAGNLYVANNFGNTIAKFTPGGVGTVFADANDGLAGPLDLTWDTAGNLYVSNAYGGPRRTGSVLKFTLDGVGSVFTDSGSLQTPFGLAFDSAGNLYVSNFSSSTIEKFSHDGIDLGAFAGSPGVNHPHGMLFDNAGNLYVANNGTDTIEKFSSTGVDLGVFAHTGDGPHFMTMFRPTETPTATPTPTPTVTATPRAVLSPPGSRRVR